MPSAAFPVATVSCPRACCRGVPISTLLLHPFQDIHSVLSTSTMSAETFISHYQTDSGPWNSLLDYIRIACPKHTPKTPSKRQRYHHQVLPNALDHSHTHPHRQPKPQSEDEEPKCAEPIPDIPRPSTPEEGMLAMEDNRLELKSHNPDSISSRSENIPSWDDEVYAARFLRAILCERRKIKAGLHVFRTNSMKPPFLWFDSTV